MVKSSCSRSNGSEGLVVKISKSDYEGIVYYGNEDVYEKWFRRETIKIQVNSQQKTVMGGKGGSLGGRLEETQVWKR